MPDAIPATVETQPTTEQPPATPPPPVAPEPKRDPMSPRLAALAKESQRLAREKQAWAAERTTAQAQIKAERDALAAAQKELEDYKRQRAGFKDDPESFLRSTLGDDWYDLATQIRLNGGKAPADLAVKAAREEAQTEVARLRKENEERWQKLEEEKKTHEETIRKQAEEEARANVAAFEAETTDFVKANPDKYELINLNDIHYLVPQVIRATYEKSKKLLTAAEAADLVEAQLDILEEKKIQTSKKLAAKWAAKTAAKPAEQPGGPRTLTNEVGETPRPTMASSTEANRYTRAIQAYDAEIAKHRAAQ